ncbi:hypothetical protein C0Q70_06902 [Pomacea canaliculata]|uniref:Uncharacterized protein n=2 Tax=Pomacea canaliculata TaxID=400727 RepID=A0A2T7PDK1_POMCA|nr:hypothetical protein C0Q70_06902 [Pomacea canaliculata]
MSSEACYKLLVRVTQVLREEYIQKQEHARHEVETRVEFLRHQKEQQLRELQELEETKENVTEKAEHIAERLELCHDNNVNLLRRLESIMRKIQSRVPVLSSAEKEMKEELKQLEERVKEYSINLKQLHKKLEYQQGYLGQPKIISQESSVIQPQQLNNIKNILHEEGDEIGHLMKQISQLKMEINL